MLRAITDHELPKPRFRGVSHQYAFFASLITGAVLVLVAPTRRATTAAAIYAASVSGLFGASALYHRVTWRPATRRWMRRLDHSMIFVLIAGTYTPFGLLILHGTLAHVVLAVVWGGALAGVVLKLAWVNAPKWLMAAIYLALGWVGAAIMPQLLSREGVGAVVLLATGGVLYSIGAVIYALRRPDPSPKIFGYHEIFHVLVIAAAAAHYAAIAGYALPASG
ncbi:MAG TPA: hemolysin III family protein [Thermoleophilaceae bacterium]|nr:hemolysin III family protein [Thermoleophilaceae bacterium]